jgi:hypothetical protein
MKRILLAAICALAAVSAYGQTQTAPPVTTPCTLKVAQAPAIRGVKLGMKIAEVLALFPGGAEKDEIKSKIVNLDGFPNFGVTDIFIFPQDYSTRNRFAGISSFHFVFLDGRVARNEVGYQPPPAWRSIDDFVGRLSDSFRLQATTWEKDKKHPDGKTLKCDGFQLEAIILDSGAGAGLTVSTSELPYEKREERWKALNEKMQREFKP